MSLIRRLQAIALIERIPNPSPEDLARAKRLRPRGSDFSLQKQGIINIQHFDAYTVLQQAPIGQRVNCAWQSKNGTTMHGDYIRKGWRANISRNWLPVGARI